MIKKSLLTFMILCIVWTLFFKVKFFSTSQHQWQDNIISAERFLFDNDSLNNLIVGSSLAARLKMDTLPQYYNLSLPGQSIFDALNILKSKKNLPKNLFIEMNVIGRGENTKFKGIISSVILNTLKKNIPIFRTDKQPLSALAKLILIPPVKKIIASRANNKIKDKKINHATKKNLASHEIFTKLLALQKKTYSKPMNKDLINENFKILTDHVSYLKSKDVKVIFFEMPINHELINLERAVFLRKKVKEQFAECNFIPIPENIDSYITSDGIHLKDNETIIYTSYFKNKASEILNGK